MKFITHPNNLQKIKQQIEKDYGKTDNDYSGIHIPRPNFLFGIEIIPDSHLNEKGMVPTGKFKRAENHSLKDNKYFEWVTEEDLNPPNRWMRDLGLIEEIYEERPIYYAINSGVTFDGFGVCKL